MRKSCTARQATNSYMIWAMRFACWITNTTDAYSEYVILTAFPQQQQQQLLRERTSMLILRIRTLPVFFNQCIR